ncbi:glycosyltransferase family 2 protein [Kitasatospora atroaurantiaca]|uniref:Dolichol-phosphate mannosyltransferase n=1 Tax=Kitasatospora atroaurantiaca TaxID=285545 RepID=A0A561EYS5_9ACTN|nr:glycosyltransferase [Kitasatospora atroaurantiaca]TWE20755.1 dolichol-phosphate mannosyltransferase [Kitasatospora atroaurantiaca]
MTTISLRPDGTPFTVVIPTRNESATIVELLARLAEALSVRPGRPGPRLLFVDDSTDHTPAVIRAAVRDYPLPVTLLHRDEPVGGVGGAVTEGLRAAEGEWAVVMDAGLQHPPQLVPELVATGRAAGADLAVATRTGPRSSTLFTKLLFARELRRISDPMSGFFAVRRDAVDLAGLRPLGCRILLELTVRGRLRRVVEVPYRFATRLAREPRPGLREGLRSLGHLAGLRLSTPLGRAAAFALIGLSGILPNLLALELLTHLGMHYLPAAILANQAGIAWNLALLEWTVYRHRRQRHWADRVLRFVGVANLDLLLRIPLLALLVSGLGLGAAPATVLSLVVSCVLRWLVAERAIYLPVPLRGSSARAAAEQPQQTPEPTDSTQRTRRECLP